MSQKRRNFKNSFEVGASNAAGTNWANYKSATTFQNNVVVDHPVAATSYSPVSGSLFGANGPSYLDVQQGQVGDCWLLSSLAETAARYPSDIRNMFTDLGTAMENGSVVELYKVRFFNTAGVPTYVTVDTELPSGGGYYDHTTNGVLWVALAEKAYAQANGAGFVTTSAVGSDSYNALNEGDPSWALQAITGKPANDFSINPTNITAAWNAGQLIVLGSSSNAGDNLIVGDSNGTHAYAVINYNASSSTPFELYNPWGLSSVVGHTSNFNGHQVYDGPFWFGSSPMLQDFASQTIGTGTAARMADHGNSSQESVEERELEFGHCRHYALVRRGCRELLAYHGPIRCGRGQLKASFPLASRRTWGPSIIGSSPGKFPGQREVPRKLRGQS